MSQVRYTSPNGTIYVYESESYWDKDLKQPRNRRKLIGKIDKETGELVPTGRKGRPKKTVSENTDKQISELKDKYELLIKQKDQVIMDQKLTIIELTKKNKDLIDEIGKIINKYTIK